MVCWGTLISVSGYRLHWPQKGQKGHMTLETYPVTMLHFCFLTAVSLWCCYLYLQSYSAISWHMGQLSISFWFFLFIDEREWSVHQWLCVWNIRQLKTHMQATSHMTIKHFSTHKTSVVVKKEETGNSECGQEYFWHNSFFLFNIRPVRLLLCVETNLPTFCSSDILFNFCYIFSKNDYY